MRDLFVTIKYWQVKNLEKTQVNSKHLTSHTHTHTHTYTHTHTHTNQKSISSEYLSSVNTEAYLETCKLSMIKRFCENSSWLSAANHIRKKALPLLFDRILCTPLQYKTHMKNPSQIILEFQNILSNLNPFLTKVFF